ISRHHWMYFGCQCSSARCSRLLPDRLTLFGIFSAEIIWYPLLLNPHRRTRGNTDSGPLPIELRPSLLSVHLERPLLADCVRTLEDPVLPRSQPSENFRLHRLGPGEAQVRLEPGHRVWRKRRARLDREPHLVVPLNLVRRERHEAVLFGIPRIERRCVLENFTDLSSWPRNLVSNRVKPLLIVKGPAFI